MSPAPRFRARPRRGRRLGMERLEGRSLLSGYAPSYDVFGGNARAGQAAQVDASQSPVAHPAKAGAARRRALAARSKAAGGFVTTQVAVAGPEATGVVRASLTSNSAPYTAAQIRHAYGVDQLPYDGSGQTIAIIGAYDDPTIAADLHAFDVAMGLPDPVLLKAVPKSGTPRYDPGWAGEIALDVEWAHALAPKATILLVEARSSSYNDLMSAVDYAAASGAKQISMSWGGSDFPGVSAYDPHFNRPGVTFLTASGDDGAGASYPSASPWVTSVGGTTLTLDGRGNRASETVWRYGGGGASVSASRPKYQNGFTANRRRGIPDVAFDADPNTGVMVYDTSSGGGSGWYAVGGTSAGSPAWAGIMALVNQGRAAAGKASLGTGLTYGTNQVLYALAGNTSYTNPAGAFNDIVAGSNGYAATPGYDLATGLGSPNADKLVPALIQA